MKNFSYFAIITKNGVDYRFFMLDMTAEDVIDFIKDFDLDKLGKCCSIKKIDVAEGMDINKTSLSKK